MALRAVRMLVSSSSSGIAPPFPRGRRALVTSLFLGAASLVATQSAMAQDAPPPPPSPPVIPPASAPPANAPPANAPPVSAPPASAPAPYPQAAYPPYAPPPYAPPPYAPPSAPGAAWAPPDRQPSATNNWYGWQTLIAVAPFDIAMFAGMATYSQTAGQAAFVAGFVGRNLAPAVVHMAHHRYGTAFGSIGLHAGMTATGFAIGYGIAIALQPPCKAPDPCRSHFESIPPGVGYGAIAGSMLGTVLDTVFFTYRQRLSWTASAPVKPAKVAWAIAPYAAPTAYGGTGGLAAAGTF